MSVAGAGVVLATAVVVVDVTAAPVACGHSDDA
jgi:hypothetical protein